MTYTYQFNMQVTRTACGITHSVVYITIVCIIYIAYMFIVFLYSRTNPISVGIELLHTFRIEWKSRKKIFTIIDLHK